MKFTPIIFALILLLTACSLRDAKRDQQILGAWTGQALDYRTITFAPGGGFSFVSNVTTNIFAGTWQVKDGDWIVEITNAPSLYGHPIAGPEMRSKIVSIDAHKFVYISGGRTVTLSRR